MSTSAEDRTTHGENSNPRKLDISLISIFKRESNDVKQFDLFLDG